jgi:uncharacterized membrane protein YsdA (DUF1294 family)/cold shock CspA family protein
VKQAPAPSPNAKPKAAPEDATNKVTPAKIPTAIQHGVVVKFDNERAFGFIRPDSAQGAVDQDVFVHVRNVEGRKNLHPGQRVSYRLTRTDKGLAAIDVHPGSVLGIPYLRFLLIGVGSAILLLIGLAFALDKPTSLALWLVLWVAALSIATFGVYGWDKSQAKAGGTRVPEVVLHLLDALGGSPGGFIAMRVFHHKTSKRDFQVIYWLTVAVQVSVIAWWILNQQF